MLHRPDRTKWTRSDFRRRIVSKTRNEESRTIKRGGLDVFFRWGVGLIMSLLHAGKSHLRRRHHSISSASRPPSTLSSQHPVLPAPCPPSTLSSQHPVLPAPCPPSTLSSQHPVLPASHLHQHPAHHLVRVFRWFWCRGIFPTHFPDSGWCIHPAIGGLFDHFDQTMI
jgi:hypothetical protein